MSTSGGDDDMTLKDIRRWYAKHGMPYLAEDWAPRSDTGESDRPQSQVPERRDILEVQDPTPERQWWWEDKHLLWEQRSREEQDWVELLDEFFSPYIAMLSRPKGNVLRQFFSDLATVTEAAKKNKRARSSTYDAMVRAVHDLTRLIANDDPLFRPPADGRRRDYEEEARAARRVFVVYLNSRGNSS